MENKSNVKSNSLQVIEKIQGLTENIDLLTEEIYQSKNFSFETFAKISSYHKELNTLIKSDKAKYKCFEDLLQHYKEKKKNLIKLWEITELKRSLEITEPEQKNNDMFYKIIQSCIIACENLKKNNFTSKSLRDRVNSDTEVNGNQLDIPLNIDVDKLEELYKELLDCDEISDFLYSEITYRTAELGQVYERLNDENAKII